MRILALDLSTHSGYAIFEGETGSKPSLLNYNTIHLGEPVHGFGPYPACYRVAARTMARKLLNNVAASEIDVVIIEEINLGRNRYTQKLLENIHTAVLDELETWPKLKEVVYLDSSEWRHNLGLRMSKEQKRSNAKLSKAKRTAATSRVALDKKVLGIRGKISAKHLSVAHANEVYGLKLKMKDNDVADAICLGLAYCNKATPCDGV